MLDAAYLSAVLTERFGLPFAGEAFDDTSGQRCRFRPADLPRTQGFSVEVLIGWRTVETNFAPATFAGHLLSTMEHADAQHRALFTAFVRAAIDDGGKVEVHINNAAADPLNPSSWPAGWKSLGIAVSKGPMHIDGGDPNALQSLALTWAGRLTGAVLTLIPLEPTSATPAGQAEGGGVEVLSTRYERSPINRAACIELQGARCKVCGFDFEMVYGAIGRGFIEVHHIKPVSGIAAGTILDPAVDLAPVCPNCHAMLHRRMPPYSVDELRQILAVAADRRGI